MNKRRRHATGAIKMTLIRSITLWLLLVCSFATFSAERTGYLDAARIVAVEPVTETVRRPGRQRECRPLERLSEPPAPGKTLGEDIRRQLRAVDAEPPCRWVESVTTIERTVGYRVTYLYAGRRFVRYTSTPPAQGLPVRVRLEPLH